MASLNTQFGGDSPHGTLSELTFSYPTFDRRVTQLDFVQDNIDTLKEFFEYRCTSSLGTLMSMLPELRDYYRLVTKTNSRTHPLEVTRERSVRGLFRFHIGDGERQPTRADLAQSFPGAVIDEKHGKCLVDVEDAAIHKIRAHMVADALGKSWYVENPFFPLVLPEISLHFLLMNSLSNIMRYSPHRWGVVLSNEVNSGTALLIRKYLSVFENKFPFIVLRDISRFWPHVG
jgi:hypothetical protein